MELNILTFNWHEPYLCLLSRIGHRFRVVEPEIAPGKIRHWDENMRPLPGNMELWSLEQAREALDRGDLDLVIAHNVKDLARVREFSLPKIMVFHNRLTTEIALGGNRVDRDRYLAELEPLLDGVQKIFISESKRSDWGLAGEVIRPGLDVEQYGGYTGETPCVLRVGNLLKERDLMMGFTRSEPVLEGLPTRTLGVNPGVPGARLSAGWDDLQEQYRTCRVYFHSTVEDYEDGYNLALLEAMATGMPVVSFANRTSPLRDGIDGFLSEDPRILQGRLKELLQDPARAREWGNRARDTVRREFGLQDFVNSWTRAVHRAAVEFLESSGIQLSSPARPFHEKARKNVLLDYVSYPATTAAYLERALRKEHNVITCGGLLSGEIIRRWNLESLAGRLHPQEIARDPGNSLSGVLTQVPAGWKPDVYLWVESGLDSPPPDLERHSLPKACYLIDTHLHWNQHLEWARRFDVVFLAQKAYVDRMKSEGLAHVFWLPLGCDPEIHGKLETESRYDVAFAGTVGPAHGRRHRLLQRIEDHFHLARDRCFLEAMARMYSESKIIFNHAVAGDLNMRVFEALCSGSLLVTDPAPGSGLDEFFRDREHLVIYPDEASLIPTIRYYLDHPDERHRIAEEGRREVLARHTYTHRVRDLMRVLDSCLGDEGDPEPAAGKPDSYYHHAREDLLPLVPDDAACILDVGCAAGGMARELKKTRRVFVAGIENHPDAAHRARQILDDVVEGDIEQLDLPYEDHSFDCVIFADVLEHLVNPLAVLEKVRRVLKPGGTVVASLPNVQYFGVLHQLAEGRWTYEKEGILDETHLRFFTFREIEKLFSRAGFEITGVEETLDPQFETDRTSGNRDLRVGRLILRDLTPEEMRRFFVFQYKLAARLISRVNFPDSDAPDREEISTSRETAFRQAKAKEIQKQFQAALDAYQALLDRHPDCAEAWVGVGNCRLNLGNPVPAERAYRRAVQENPRHAPAHLGLGLLELQRDSAEAAEIHLQQARSLDPENSKILCALGMLSRRGGRPEEAFRFFHRALDKDLENSIALTQLLGLAYETGRLGEGERALRRYLDRHPANLNILFGLAGLLFKKGRFGECRDILERMLLFDPESPDARKLLEQLEAADIGTA